jgi:hypothetical protein
MRKIVLALLILIMAASVAAADTVYLRDGRTIRGTVLGYINGRFAVRLTSVSGTATTSTGTGAVNATDANAGEILFLRPRDIERIEIEGRSLDDARYVSRSVQVELGPNWIDSGVDLRRGERVQVTATGTIVAGRTRITPGGLRSTDPSAPLPRAAEGVLIGAIGNDPNAPIIEIGLTREFIADRDGRLYLTANRSTYTDARGAFTAQVRREIDFTPRTGRNRDNNRNDDDDGFDAFGSGQSTPAPARPRTSSAAGTNAGSTTTTQTNIEKTIVVPGNQPRGVDTGIDLRTGDQVTISASGNITAGRRAGVVAPDGGRVSAASALGVGAYPVPNAGVGALIGVLRTPSGQLSQPFFVGSQLAFNSPADGRLFLLVNDDNYSDNSGSFDVRITVSSSSSSSQVGGQTGGGQSIDVPGDSEGTDTGINLRRGDRVTINASGFIYPVERGNRTTPDGMRVFSSARQSFPLPDANQGALIGYIRLNDGTTTRPFNIGSQRTFTATDDGRLFLLINDDDYRDNTGSFSVRITY